jgi:3-oxoacyl-[acyl-carrier protein] reductase
VLTGRGREALKQVESTVNDAGGQALGVQADLASLKDSQGDRAATQRFGRVDILVNNAAVFPPGLFIETSDEAWDKMVDTDLKGSDSPSPMS